MSKDTDLFIIKYISVYDIRAEELVRELASICHLLCCFGQIAIPTLYYM